MQFEKIVMDALTISESCSAIESTILKKKKT